MLRSSPSLTVCLQILRQIPKLTEAVRPGDILWMKSAKKKKKSLQSSLKQSNFPPHTLSPWYLLSKINWKGKHNSIVHQWWVESAPYLTKRVLFEIKSTLQCGCYNVTQLQIYLTTNTHRVWWVFQPPTVLKIQMKCILGVHLESLLRANPFIPQPVVILHHPCLNCQSLTWY